jgi:hypothetical protein
MGGSPMLRMKRSANAERESRSQGRDLLWSRVESSDHEGVECAPNDWVTHPSRPDVATERFGLLKTIETSILQPIVIALESDARP